MDIIHIAKGSVQETLIIPLYGRKLCEEQFPTLYQDEYAAKICEWIDYDFSQLLRCIFIWSNALIMICAPNMAALRS